MVFTYRKVTAGEIADAFGYEISGDSKVEVSGFKSLDLAGPGDVSFILSKNHVTHAEKSNAPVLILKKEWVSRELSSRTLLLTENPKLAMARVHSFMLKDREEFTGVSDKAEVSASASVADEVKIYPFVYVGENTAIEPEVIIYPHVYIGDNVKIGKGTVIHSGSSVYHDSIIGKNCIIHSGTRIGADGFGFVKDGMTNVKVPQVGSVEIGDDCELGANNTVDRAAFGVTEVGNNVKTDNQVHIGHNCKIGDHTIIVACSGIAGSTEFGKNVTMAGSSGVIDHIKIGDNSIIGTHSIVTRDMPAGKVWTGYPAIEHSAWLRSSALIPKLPELAGRIREIEKKLKD